jgi:hypothetical protein
MLEAAVNARAARLTGDCAGAYQHRANMEMPLPRREATENA